MKSARVAVEGSRGADIVNDRGIWFYGVLSVVVVVHSSCGYAMCLWFLIFVVH